MTGTDYVPLKEEKNEDISFREKLQKQIREYETNGKIMENIKDEIYKFSLDTHHRTIMLYISFDKNYMYPESLSDFHWVNQLRQISVKKEDCCPLDTVKTNLKKLGFEVKKSAGIRFFQEKYSKCNENSYSIGYYLLISWKRIKKNASDFFYKIRQQTENNRKKVSDDLNREIEEQFENIKKILDERSKKGWEKIWFVFVNNNKYCRIRDEVPSFFFRNSRAVVLQTKYYLGKSLGKKFVDKLCDKLIRMNFSVFSYKGFFTTEENYSEYLIGHFIKVTIIGCGCPIL